MRKHKYTKEQIEEGKGRGRGRKKQINIDTRNMTWDEYEQRGFNLPEDE